MGIRNAIRKVGEKTADYISRLSALSPDQVDAIIEQRKTYLSEMPDLMDPEAQKLTAEG